ncbi:MAG: glutamine amidotransferase-related protein [bacterium]
MTDEPKPTTTPKLRVGLLLCDDVDETAQARYGTYAAMFQSGLRAADAGLEAVAVNCHLGEMPESPDAFDAYIISGSRHAAYDSLPWIIALRAFVRSCRERRRKTVGICFGHQLIAHALGGETRKAAAGWGFGIQSARITAPQPWMDAPQREPQRESPRDNGRYNLVVIHQDQVVKLPPDAHAIAANDFCPISMFVADDVMLGIQGHPEFDKAFCAFRADRRKQMIGAQTHRRALESLAKMEPDSAEVFGWIARFIRSRS